MTLKCLKLKDFNELTNYQIRDKHGWIFSNGLIERFREHLSNTELEDHEHNYYIINTAYTDYGGSFLDDYVTCRWLEENNEICETEFTNWSGKNALFLLHDPNLDFDNLQRVTFPLFSDDYMMEIENELKAEETNRLMREEPQFRFIGRWHTLYALQDYASCIYNGFIDYDLDTIYEEAKRIKKEESN